MSRLIDGDELLKWMDETQWHTSKMDAVRAKIKSMPSAERKGEWIETEYTDCGATVYMCSVCTHGISDIKVSNYCPNCGARMKGAEDE